MIRVQDHLDVTCCLCPISLAYSYARLASGAALNPQHFLDPGRKFSRGWVIRNRAKSAGSFVATAKPSTPLAPSHMTVRFLYSEHVR